MYSFFCLITLGFFLCTFFFLNLGRNLSHDSFFSLSSFSSSLLIMSSLMWKMGWTFLMQSSTILRTTLRPLYDPMADTVLPCTRM